MIDLELMRRRPVWTLNLVAFLVGVGIYSIFAFLPQFLQTPPDRAGYGFGATVTESGLIVIPSAAATLVIGSLCGRLVARFGAKSMIILGCSGGGCAALLMAFVHSHTWQISIASSILGASFGLSFSAMSGLVVAVVRLTETGVASGMNANIRTIGGAVGAAAVGSIVTSTVQANGFPTESGYSLAFAAVALAMLGAALAGTIIPEGVVRRGVDVVTHVMPEAVGVAPSLVSSHGVAAPSAPGARAARPSVRGA
jgi:MFS family permease